MYDTTGPIEAVYDTTGPEIPTQPAEYEIPTVS